MIASRYLRYLVAAAFGWALALLAFTLLIDPYGVSPVHATIQGVNALKPKRLDIDRLIKPYEVWRRQPQTVFLGTSRIHQSIDPAVLDGTRFAPAYNASIPASSLSLNITHLENYLRLNPGLKTIFVELFVYNFLGQGQNREVADLKAIIWNTATLFISSNALWDSVATFFHNALIGRPTYEIKPGGYFYYPPDSNANFAGFSAGIWKYHPKDGLGLRLHEPAFDTVRDIIELARAKGLELIFIVSPNHAYVDYYFDAVGAWPLMEQWLTRLSQIAPIYSFSQPNAWVYERVAPRMTYWNDPFHFSLEMGRGIQASVAGLDTRGLPEEFMVRLTPELVPAHIESRRQAIRRWAADNPDFVAKFDEERQKWLAANPQGASR